MSSRIKRSAIESSSGRSLAAVSAVFCAVALGYWAGIQQARPEATPQRTYQLSLDLFGRPVHLILTVGMLGIAVIFILTVLLATSVLLTIIAYRRRRQVEAANRELRREVIERQRAQHEVAALNADLERRVAERTRELEAANAELEAFCSSVSHDLRAPLRGIDGFSAALVEDYRATLDERGRGYVDRIRNAAQRMAQLIDDLLALSRVARAEMRRQEVDLTALAQAIVAELRRAEPERKVSVTIVEGLAVRGDSRLLQGVVENLLANAWKYSSRRPEARIEVGTSGEKNGRPVYFVQDNGAGFDMRYASKLFKPFQRLHSASEFPGTGVGLATAQRIIQRHGGEIWATSVVDQGSTFYFTV